MIRAEVQAPGRLSSFQTRVLSAAVLLPVVAAILYVGGSAWIAFVVLAAAIASAELNQLLELAGVRSPDWIAPLITVGLVLAAVPAESARPILALGIILTFAVQIRRPRDDRSIADWSAGLAAPVYLGVLFGYGILLRALPHGLEWTGLLLFLVWSNDSAAYIVGRLAGRHPMAPDLSPKKTWEGAAAGTAASVAAGALAPTLAGALGNAVPALASEAVILASPLSLATLGLLVAFVAPIGDLSKSLLKRQAGVKDAGTLIPGHGGIMDRVDSVLFAAPVVYYWVLWLI